MKSTRFSVLLTLVLFLTLLFSVSSLAQAKDRNNDRIPDRWEKKYNLSLNKDQRKLDQDKDGLKNLSEYRSKTSPRAADTDSDDVDDTLEDRDKDSVDNGNEQRQGTRCNDKDSDNDGKRDGREDRDKDGLKNAGEDRSGNDPIDRDTDDDGTLDGDENAGVVSSYDEDTGELTITLAAGGTVSGLVDESTEFKCSREGDLEGDREHHGDGGDRPHHGDEGDRPDDGDHSGPGRDSSILSDGDRGPDEGDNSGPGDGDDPRGDDGDRPHRGDDDGQRPGRDHGDRESDFRCGDNLEVGVAVREAELDEDSGIFSEIKLVALGC